MPPLEPESSASANSAIPAFSLRGDDCLPVVRETGLEPVRCYHTPLKRARLPVPPLSHSGQRYHYTRFCGFVKSFLKKSFVRLRFFGKRNFLPCRGRGNPVCKTCFMRSCQTRNGLCNRCGRFVRFTRTPFRAGACPVRGRAPLYRGRDVRLVRFTVGSSLSLRY